MQNAFCGNLLGILLDAPGMSAYYGTWAALAKDWFCRRFGTVWAKKLPAFSASFRQNSNSVP